MKAFNLNFVLFITCTLQLTALPSAFAQGDTTSSESIDQSIPTGLRVSYQTYYMGEIEAVIEATTKAGRIKGYSHVPSADHAFAKGHKGGENPLKPTAKAAIENGEADAVVFGKWWCWQFGEGDESAINLTAKWGAENNPKFRLLWQTHWALLSNEKLKRRGDVIIPKENYLAPEDLKPSYDKAHKELEVLTPKQAKELVSKSEGTLSLNRVSEVSLEVARILAEYKGELRLNAIQHISPEVALALSKQPKGANLCLNGLIEISPEVAEALAVRKGGMLSLNALKEISPEVADQLANVKGKLTLNGLIKLPPEVAKGLAQHRSKLTLFALPDLSNEAAEILSHHRGTYLLNGLTRLESPVLIESLLRKNDGFLNFNQARTMSDDVAAILAKYEGRKTIKMESLVKLPEAHAADLRGNEKIVLPAHLLKPAITNSLGMKLTYIPAGKFEMGSPRDEAGRKEEERRHGVELTRDFYLGIHEVTFGQFRAFIEDSGYKTDTDKDGNGSWGITPKGKFERDAKYDWKSPGFEQCSNHPVVDVSWNDAKAFCKWLSQKEGKTYRLPTEAEWEYACRAGTRTAYSFGENPEDLAKAGNAADASARAQFSAWSLGIKGNDGYAYSSPVGQFQPNRFGLYDMHGNVWEWCEDWYAEDAYPRSSRTDPTGPETGTMRVHRGGGWSSAPERCRSASRIRRHPSEYRGCYLGFRVLHMTDETVFEKENSKAYPNPKKLFKEDPNLRKPFENLVYDLGKGVTLELVKIQAKGKTFMIGSSKEEQEEVARKYFGGKSPPRIDFEDSQSVTLTHDYFIGKHEITRGQFRRFIEETGYKTITEKTDGGYGWNEELRKYEGRDRKYNWENTGHTNQNDAYPVTNITKEDARQFCRWIAEKGDGKVEISQVRLPSEAEWEYACRAGTQGRFSFGDADEKLVLYANVSDMSRKAEFPSVNAVQGNDGYVFMAPVGQFMPNAFGLYDMHGNAWEWVEDYFGKYSQLPKTNNGLQTVNQGERRPMMRGGAWYLGPGDCRIAKRYIVGMEGRYGSGGFRIVCLP